MSGKTAAPPTVVGLSWAELNSALLRCDDLATLQRWFKDVVVKTGSLTRALRVYSRMSVVRREAELTALKAAVAAKNKEAA
jgi:hypothetical protein